MPRVEVLGMEKGSMQNSPRYIVLSVTTVIQHWQPQLANMSLGLKSKIACPNQQDLGHLLPSEVLWQ